MEDHFCIQDRYPHRVKVTPQVNVEPVLPVSGIDGLPVPDDTGHHAENLVIRNTILAPDVVVAANHIIVGANLQDAVKDVLVAAFIKNNIVTFSSALKRANLDDVAAFAQKGHHAHTDIGIKKKTYFFEYILELICLRF